MTAGLVSDSALISAGTVISRLTGVARVLVIPAVFGATALGDMFLATNSLPITLFAMFGGQALVSVLVPALVRRLNESVHLGQRLAQTALGAVMMATAVLAVLGVAFHRVIAGLLAAGVDQASGARSIAAVLLLFIVPQVVLYGMVAVFVAVQHAHGKFFLASFAPAVENVALVAGVLAMTGVFGDLHLATSSDTRILVSLGLISSAALVVHVLLQAFGAFRAGAPVRPAVPRDLSDLAGLASPLRSNLSWALVFGLQFIALVVASGWAGTGAIQATQISLLIKNLPVALVGYPVAAALLPRLSSSRSGSSSIAWTYTHARVVVVWAVVPLGAAMIFLAPAMSRLVALGRFDTAENVDFISYALVGLGMAAISESLYELGRQASLAYGDLRGFRSSIWVRAGVSIVGIATTLAVLDGKALLLGLGLTLSVADISALAFVDRPLSAGANANSLWRDALRPVLAALVAGCVALVVMRSLPRSPALGSLLVSGTTFAVVYGFACWLLTDRFRTITAAIALTLKEPAENG